jgi:hypothetical protein
VRATSRSTEASMPQTSAIASGEKSLTFSFSAAKPETLAWMYCSS